jgi:hypothetical protein
MITNFYIIPNKITNVWNHQPVYHLHVHSWWVNLVTSCTGFQNDDLSNDHRMITILESCSASQLDPGFSYTHMNQINEVVHCVVPQIYLPHCPERGHPICWSATPPVSKDGCESPINIYSGHLNRNIIKQNGEFLIAMLEYWRVYTKVPSYTIISYPIIPFQSHYNPHMGILMGQNLVHNRIGLY